MEEKGRTEKKSVRFPIYLFPVVFVFIIAFLLFEPRAEAFSEKNVLVLNSYHSGYPWSDNILKGIKSVLKNEKKDIFLDIEYMDTKRINDEEHFQNLFELYQHKFAGQKYDVIISSDNNAFNFLLEQRDRLFPDVPVVFCGVNGFEDSMIAGQKKITGVSEDVDIKSTIDIVLKLRPDTRRVFVISDSTESGIINLNELLKIIPEYDRSIIFEIRDDFTKKELVGRIKSLPEDSAILHLSFARDVSGKVFTLEESLGFISGNAGVPVYVCWEGFLEHGATGGMMVSGYHQGKAAGEMALRILNGEKAKNIPVMKESPNKYMFDYTQLQRFGIKFSALPENSIIINRPLPFYSVYKEVMWAVIAIIAVLTLSVFGLLLNTVKRKHAETALIESERSLKEAQEIGKIASWTVDVPSQKGYWSDEFFHLLGCQVGEVDPTFENFLSHVHPDDRELIEKSYGEALGNVRPLEVEFRFFRKDGTLRFAHSKANIERDKLQKPKRVIGTMHDITERKEAEEKIKKSLEEKELLLQEIHHRVKNNMQVISSMLALQTAYVEDEKTETILEECQNRIKSMSLIHEKLYVTEDFSRIDFREYIDTLSQTLSDFYKKEEKIVFTVDVKDVFLDIDTAVPLGLIINELVTNSLKHAFSGKEEGEIGIFLSQMSEEDFELRVKDNGNGIPEDFDIKNQGSLGLQIVTLLAEKQLHGSLSMNRSGGTEFCLVFKKAKHRKIK